MSKVPQQEPRSCMWAYCKGKFLHRWLDPSDRQSDHPGWFHDLGLPDCGLEYDRILRGRLIWNRHSGYYELTFYGRDHLPNQVYQLVCQHLNPEGHRIVEKPIPTSWVGF